MRTLLLDQAAWDLVIDAQGNIAVADAPYALAQDAASAIRTFQGEVYYDTTLGVPYFQRILGRFPSAQLMKAQFAKQALSVPGVASAACFLSAGPNRQVTGQVQITDQTGATVALTTPIFTPSQGGVVGQFDFTDPRQSGLSSLI